MGLGIHITCLELLSDRNVIDAKTECDINAWLIEYADWLYTGEIESQEGKTLNNHATHYDVQLLSSKVYLGENEFVKEYVSTGTKSRIFSQIEPDGSQPKETARTKFFSYSTMNLHGFLYLVRLGEKVDVDLWSAKSEDGRSIKKGYQYMDPYLVG